MNYIYRNRPAGVKREPQGSVGCIKPLHVQRIEKALELGPFFSHVQSTLNKNYER